MQAGFDAQCRLVIADPIHSIGNLDLLRRAPAGDKWARDRRVEEVDGKGIVHDASRTRRGRRPPIGPAICIQPCDDLVQPVAESFGRNANSDPDRKSEFGFPKGPRSPNS